jgi:hypothetical protein
MKTPMEHGSSNVKRENIDGVLDRRRQWKFSLKEKDGSWAWHVSSHGKTQESSARSFNTLDECLADAASHGYVVYEDTERRRPEFPGWDD